MYVVIIELTQVIIVIATKIFTAIIELLSHSTTNKASIWLYQYPAVFCNRKLYSVCWMQSMTESSADQSSTFS